MDKVKPAYSTRQIRQALTDYVILAEGKKPNDGLADPDYGIRIQKSQNLEAPFIKPIIKKSDLDMAIQALKPMQRSIIITICIAGFNYSEVGYWWNKDWLVIKDIEQYSVRQIKRILNEGITLHNDAKSDKKGFYDNHI
jgi:hypothetical protein